MDQPNRRSPLTVRVAHSEQGLLFYRGKFARVLGPGTYRLWLDRVLGRRPSVEVITPVHGRFVHPLLESMLKHARSRAAFTVIDVEPGERALVWIGETLAGVHGPGRYAYWNACSSIPPVRVERFAANGGRLVHARVREVLASRDAAAWLTEVRVAAGKEAFVYQNGSFVERLASGDHAYWKSELRLRVYLVNKPVTTSASIARA